MLSTPIINPPQSGILGMHNIIERIAVNGRNYPMMYVALSYDHRIIDGRESVGFLVAVKEALENPMELLLDNNPKHLNCKFKHIESNRQVHLAVFYLVSINTDCSNR
jgi:hypothetical protein